ncbi:TonB-dependent receptor plug domain-containing protein [Seongchinamella sediminis]|uniref:TonB-dependent receptor plug domain-containing protein n=1 Tax=Seongchinamella sediminis TaxID=2283635 RepID=UPI001EEF9C54|nr:TonB-dependent receptor [Seongchinamella sediminis]
MKKLVTVLALAAASNVSAQGESRLEEIIVVSSRVPMPLREIGTSVSALSADEIRFRGYSSLYQLLRTQAGVAVTNTGGMGTPSAVRIRGEEGYRTRAYIDGIDISDPSNLQMSPNFEHLMSAGVDRVEILRGPQGLMYGADAGGVIDITTRRATDGFSGSVEAEGGRYDSQRVSANVAGGNDRVDFAASAADYETEGFNSRADDLSRDRDGYDNTSLHGRLGFNVTEDLRLELVARDVEGEGEYDNCYNAVTFALSNDCINEYEQQAWRVGLSYAHGSLTHQLAYSHSDTERQFFAAGAPSFGNGEGELDRTTYTGTWKASEDINLVYGVDLRTDAFDNGYADRERDQEGYYAEYQGNHLDNLYVTAGIRYDDNEDFGSHTTYRLSGAYLLPVGPGEMKIKAAYGTGFRAPSLYELNYNETGFPPASELDLDAEESEGYDLGLVWAMDNGLYLEATYFDQDIDKEIYFDLDFFSGYLQGQGRSESKGVELVALAPLALGFSLNANYTYNDTSDFDGEQRARRPEQLFNLGLKWATAAERFAIGLNVRGAYDAVDTSGEALADYEVVDLSADWRVVKGLHLFGRVENLTDEDYVEVPGFNSAGAAAYLGARYSF